MSSWLKSRNDVSEYEPLNPQPPRNEKKKMLKMALISAGVGLVVTMVLVVVILNGTTTPGTNLNKAEGNVLLLKSGGDGFDETLILKAEGQSRASGGDGLSKTALEDIVVEIDQGFLRGMTFKSRGGRDYLGFMGIPYAKPPLGELRFKPPVEAEPWEGTLNATKQIPACIQKDKYNAQFVIKGSEDCLFLNIYTPKKLDELRGRRNKFPVMLYLHGGGQYGNATRYRPDYFMDEDVVLVLVHYRLGVMGNLNTNDSSSRGNQGLKDQVMALQWIKDNIKRFGGNRRRVTLFGNSYGGMEVHSHLLSPMSKGLFHGAICESGGMLFPGMTTESPRQTAFNLGEKMNCSTNNSTKLVKCLRKLSADELIRQSYLDPFLVSVESPSEKNEDTFMPDHPLRLLQNGDLNEVPVIFGVNSAETLFMSLGYLNDVNMTQTVNEHWNETMSVALRLDSAKDPNAIATAAREFYLGGMNVSRETQANFTNLLTDRNYIHPTTVAAMYQSQFNGRGHDVFLYFFNREVAKKYSAPEELVYGNTDFLGASHADELQLLFPYDDFPYVTLDSEYAFISQTMVKLWVSFAADGIPSGTTNEWLPITANEKPYHFFQLDDDPKMVDPVGERMKFWDRFNLTDLYVTGDNLNSTFTKA